MVEFDERDLLTAAERACFSEAHLDYQVDIGHEPIDLPFEALLRSPPP